MPGKTNATHQAVLAAKATRIRLCHMKFRRVLLPLVCLANCAWFTKSPAPSPDWQFVMRELDLECEQLDQWLIKERDSNLKQAADHAEHAASLARLGYGPCNDVHGPRFATYARDTETWLMQIAIESRLGHAAVAADLLKSGRTEHCSQCQNAADAAK
jgi:hypothetical protein